MTLTICKSVDKINLKYFVLLIFSNIIFASYSQDTSMYFLNKDWKKCKKNEASYYRKMYKKNNLWMVEDYYISGNIQMTGSYTKKNLKVREGDFTYFYENGQISYKYHLTKNLYNGIYFRYFENGTISSTGMYVLDNLEGEWISNYKNGKAYSKIEYRNSKFNGDCYWYFENGQMSSHENYSMNELNSIEYWNEDGTSYSGETEVEVLATFDGGNKAFLKFIQENIVYPEKAIERNIKGKVMIKFVIDTEGEVTNVKITKSVNPLLDKEALRVIKSMPNWNPGKLHNIPVNSFFTVPINFSFN